jgi:hypothetical protein
VCVALANLAIQSNSSKIAIASDLWTSKNSVYAFAGTVAFWIDDDWNLNECVLELLPLSGDHSGKASGKLIFKALRHRGIEMKLSKSSNIKYHDGNQINDYRYLQVQMVPTMPPAMGRSTSPSASIFEKSAISISVQRTCRSDVVAMS